MRLSEGDKIVCIMDDIDDLTYGKSYEIVSTRNPSEFYPQEDDICIKDDMNLNWWFGQIGATECWTTWFVTEQQWNRQKKIDQLI